MRRQLSPALRTITCLSLLVSPLLASDVIVVDKSGGGDFTDIQGAVDAAIDGDTILVKPGGYYTFKLSGKGVSLVADGSGVLIKGGIQIVNTLIEHEILLTGFDIIGRRTSQAAGGLDVPALDLFLVRGPLRVESCVLSGAPEPFDCTWCVTGDCAAGDAVRAELALDVAFTRCTIRGGDSDEVAFCGVADNQGGRAIDVLGGTLAFYDCTISGGDGANCGTRSCLGLEQGGHGRDAIHGEDGPAIPAHVYLSGSALDGGRGGDGELCLDGAGDGGDGVHLVGPDAMVWVFDSPLKGGLAGCGVNNPSPGVPLRLEGGAQSEAFPGVSRHLVAKTPVRENTTALLRFEGRAGDRVWLISSAYPGWFLRYPFQGVILIESPGLQQIRFIGTLPPSSLLNYTLTVPSLPPGVESTVIHTQGVFRDTLGNFRLSGLWTEVVLDGAF